MLLAGLIALLTSVPNMGTEVWRNYDEVFDLAICDGATIAATDGGLVRREGEKWVPVESPAGLREIVSVDPLAFCLADGKITDQGAHPINIDRRSRSVDGGIIHDYHGGLDPGEDALDLGPKPPFLSSSFCYMRMDGERFMGGGLGLYHVLDEGEWEKVDLPTACPVTRPNGLALVGQRYVVGGMSGLYVGRPGSWEKASSEPVRQVLNDGAAAWVVFGSGAVDKVEPGTDQLFPDVFYGAVRRPWASCVGMVEGHPVFGSHGGWIERGKTLTEYYPPCLGSAVVMAVAGRDGTRWVGTQDDGLVEFKGDHVFYWNPGNGLPDTWITSLLMTDEGLIVGTATKGLFEVRNHQIEVIDSPTQRVTKLYSWNGGLVVGGMDGAWVRTGQGWTALPTGGEETTALTVCGNRLAVVTAYGVHFIPARRPTDG